MMHAMADVVVFVLSVGAIVLLVRSWRVEVAPVGAVYPSSQHSYMGYVSREACTKHEAVYQKYRRFFREGNITSIVAGFE